MGRGSKKGFAIIAIIVGAVGIGLGAYTIATVGSTLNQPPGSAASQGAGNGVTEAALQALELNGSPALGSPAAPITIVEYGDYQCPNCGRFATQIKPLIIEEYISTGKVRLIFKDFPIYGKDSLNGALAANCAAEQGKFWEMHDLIYMNQKQINSGWLSSDALREFASGAGLDMQQFGACFDGKKYAQQVEANFEEAKSIGVEGTPTFILINSSGGAAAIKGAQPFDSFKTVLDGMLGEQ